MPPRLSVTPMTGGAFSRSTPNLPTLRSLDSRENRGNRGGNKGPPAAYADKSSGPAKARQTEYTDPSTEFRSPTAIPNFSLDAAAASSSSSAYVEDVNKSTSDSSDDNDNDSDNDTVNNLLPHANPPYRPSFARSHTYLGPSTFAPPFYNRPPTPLPPSPSLTSLLRPSFSTATSRPGTPDLSSDEAAGTATTTNTSTLPTGAQTPNSAAATTLSSSFRTAKPIPRASPKVPTYEYYGFTLYLTSSLAFLMYLLWSFLPSPFLHQLGIHYYPNRWWSLAIPAWLVMLVVWLFVALASYNTGPLTLAATDMGCLVDESGVVAVVDSQGRIVRGDRSWDSGVAAASRPAVRAKKKREQSRGRQQSNKASGKAGEMMGPAPDENCAKELDWRTLWNEGTDAVLDVPIGGVCEVLYSRPHEFDVDDDDDDEILGVIVNR